MNTNKIISEYRKQFYYAYHNKIMPMLLAFKNKRQLYLTKLILIESIILSMIFGGLVYSLLKIGYMLEIFIIAGIVCFLGLIIPPCILNDMFVKELKNYCLKPVLDIFGSITWNKSVIDDAELNASELFASFNRRSTDDAFEGEYKGVKFQIAETSLAYESGSGKNRHCRQIFKGVVIKFASNKSIKGKTIIATKGDNNIKRNGWISTIGSFMICVLVQCLGIESSERFSFIVIILGVLLLIMLVTSLCNKDSKKIQPIKLEDPLFEKKFNAYSTDEIEGRYLITTAFMERFINLNTAFGSRKAKCSFYGDNVMFAISTNKNLFEIGDLFSRLDNPKQLNEFFNEIASILVLVDYFKLNQKTGL